ncbi:MAG: META domain-containing protein [Flavobacteriales bacterium]
MGRSSVTFFSVLLCLPLIMGSTCKGTVEEAADKKESSKGNSDANETVGKGLKGKEWKFLSMSSQAKEGSEKKPKGSYILRLKKDSSFFLQLKVNSCQGSYRIPEKGRISFRELTCTEACCDPDLAKEMSRKLESMSRYSLEKDRLQLEGDGSVLRFKLKEEVKR